MFWICPIFLSLQEAISRFIHATFSFIVACYLLNDTFYSSEFSRWLTSWPYCMRPMIKEEFQDSNSRKRKLCKVISATLVNIIHLLKFFSKLSTSGPQLQAKNACTVVRRMGFPHSRGYLSGLRPRPRSRSKLRFSNHKLISYIRINLLEPISGTKGSWNGT